MWLKPENRSELISQNRKIMTECVTLSGHKLCTQNMYSHLIIYDHCLSISDFLGKDDLDLHVELAHDSNDIPGTKQRNKP